MKLDKKDLLLYLVTDRSWLNGSTLVSQVEEALKGGVTCVQLREKDIEPDLFLKEALELKELCQRYHVPFLINDDVHLALKVNADGVHIGQGDMELLEARKILGEDKIIGVSAHTKEEALQAYQNGANYLGVGAIFPTTSKDDATDVSLETLQNICQIVNIPVVAIGGIGEDNIHLLNHTGVCGVAVISALLKQKDIKNAASSLKKKCILL